MQYKEKTTVEFFLTKPTQNGTLKKKISDEQMVTVPYPPSKTYPPMCSIPDDREGKGGRPTIIRYISTESSIYADEQSEEWDRKKFLDGELTYDPITFVDGRLIVPKSNTTLVEYLRKCRFNEKNSKVLGYRKRPFFEFNSTAVAKKNMDESKGAFERELSCRQMSMDEAKAVLRVSGQIKNVRGLMRPVDENRWDLVVYAKRDSEAFDSVYADPLLLDKYNILSAVDGGVLSWIGQYQDVLTDATTGTAICRAPQGKDKLTFAAKYLVEEAPETYAVVKRKLGIVVDEEVAGTDSTDINDIVASGTKEQVINAMVRYQRDPANKETRLFNAAGRDILYDTIRLVDPVGKKFGYDAVKLFLLDEANSDTYAEIYGKFINLVKEK